MKDPIEELADARLVERSLDLLIQLEKGSGTRPVLWMLTRARKAAAAAMAQFAIADPADHAAMRTIQQPIMLYDLMIESCRDLLQRGRDADSRISDKEREEIYDLATSPEDARILGIEPPPED